MQTMAAAATATARVAIATAVGTKMVIKEKKNDIAKCINQDDKHDKWTDFCVPNFNGA